MSTGTAIALAGGAVLVVFIVIKQQEKKTAAVIAQQQQKPSGPYALSLWDQFTVGSTILAGIYGGPGAATKVAGTLAS